MYKYSTFLLFLLSIQLLSQKTKDLPYTFGKISDAELNMKVYSKDSTANAVFLYNYGDTKVVHEFGQIFIRTVYYGRIKILNKNGLEHATVRVPFYFIDGNNREYVKKIKAITHNLMEPMAILSKDKIYTTTETETWKQVSFTFPNVKAGSILEFEYTFESEYFYHFNGWKFQREIPTVYSELHALIPGNWIYNRRLVGLKKLDIEEVRIKKSCFDIDRSQVADCEEMNYGMRDIPAFIEEEYMTNKNNYVSKINFELAESRNFDGTTRKYTTNWKETDKNLKNSESIGRQVKNEVFFSKNIPEGLLNISDDLERANSIYNYIKNHFVWNEEFQIFTDIDVKKAFEKGVGNISEINLSLINALNAANLDAKIMLSATRDYGLPTKMHPVLYDYNFLMAYVKINNKIYLLDATDKLMPFGMISYMSLNGYGRVLDFENGSYWHDIEPNTNTISRVTLVIDINNDIISGKYKSIENGYFALRTRADLKNKSNEEYLFELENDSKNISITKYSNFNVESIDNSLTEEMELEIEEIEKVGSMIYFNPFLNRMDKNPFQLKERSYPVDFGYKRSYTYLVKVDVPVNYIIKSIPENARLKLPHGGGSFICNSFIKNNEINIFLKFIIDKTIYLPQEYPYLKELYNQVIRTQNSLITLEKI